MPKDTIIIDSWKSLEQLGINALTGEADRLSLRLLCDVNAEGRELVIDYLGLPADTVLSPSWNSSVNDAPSVGSVMLHRESCQQLASFGLFRMGALANIYLGNQIMGVFTAERLAQYEELAKSSMADGNKAMQVDIHRSPLTGSTAPGYGTRNTHVATGRTV
jgi:hypothetical protein